MTYNIIALHLKAKVEVEVAPVGYFWRQAAVRQTAWH